MTYLWIFLAIFLFRFMLNSSYLLKTYYYRYKYIMYIGTNQGYLLNQYVEPVKSLIKSAGLSDSVIPYTEPIGYNNVVQGMASPIENLSNNREDIVHANLSLFDKAIGAFKKRVFECFSPLYWITAILFAPRNLLLYLGLDSDKVGFKLCNIVFTLIWWVLGTSFVFYKDKLLVLIDRLLNQL